MKVLKACSHLHLLLYETLASMLKEKPEHTCMIFSDENKMFSFLHWKVGSDTPFRSFLISAEIY